MRDSVTTTTPSVRARNGLVWLQLAALRAALFFRLPQKVYHPQPYYSAWRDGEETGDPPKKSRCIKNASVGAFKKSALPPKIQKSATISITSNLTIHAWSIKCIRKRKRIAQFGWKLRDERFEPN